MSTTPIFDAETVLATAIRNALVPIAGTLTDGRPRVFWQLAEQDPTTGKSIAPPFLVAQPQAPIVPVEYVGRLNVSALITIRALHTSAKAARELAALAGPQMALLSYDGLTLSARWVNSPIIPRDNAGVYTSAHQFRITIERN